MDLGLSGLRAFIGGSSRGLGYATAKELAREGCQVILNGRDQAKLEKAAENIEGETGTPASYLAGNIADPSLGSRIIEEAATKLGGLDLLVTNTGGPQSGKFDSLDEDAWQDAINLVLMSHVRLIKAALPALKRSPHPSGQPSCPRTCN